MNTPLVRLALALGSAALLLAAVVSLPLPERASGQEEPASPAAAEAPAGDQARPEPEKAINIFSLAVAGGIFMIPIAAMSLLAVTIAIERALALRRSRVLPRGLVTELGEMSSWAGGIDAQRAHRICLQFPSAGANVVRAMINRVGRPLAEIESAAATASQREADKLYANVRWLNLAASLSTMLGLIGTIQGMIMAFHRLTFLDATADRTTMLAAGIYTALVTTFAGLAVAIPALFASHYFEGRILGLFHEIEDLVQNLVPQLSRAESRPHAPETGNGDQRKVASSIPAAHAS
jgi:biopolymer transport protein ExbB